MGPALVTWGPEATGQLFLLCCSCHAPPSAKISPQSVQNISASPPPTGTVCLASGCRRQRASLGCSRRGDQAGPLIPPSSLLSCRSGMVEPLSCSQSALKLTGDQEPPGASFLGRLVSGGPWQCGPCRCPPQGLGRWRGGSSVSFPPGCLHGAHFLPLEATAAQLGHAVLA